MRGWKIVFVVVAAFVLGLATAVVAGKGKGPVPATYRDKEAKEAGLALLAIAEAQAGTGSWELIGVGRVYYLSGDKAKGQALFERVTSRKAEKDDWERIGKVYLEAGEWEKAEAVFRRILDMDSEDDSGQALAGALYNLHGNRTRAEELFDRSFKKSSENVWNTLNAAGSYLGVEPD